jgi:hypothetical protein
MHGPAKFAAWSPHLSTHSHRSFAILDKNSQNIVIAFDCDSGDLFDWHGDHLFFAAKDKPLIGHVDCTCICFLVINTRPRLSLKSA